MKINCVIIVALVLALVLFGGCGKSPQAVDYPLLTPEQVIAQVHVYGVPEIPYNASPVGQWSAVYESNGVWRVQGTVIIEQRYWGESPYHSTTWLYSSEMIKLVAWDRKQIR